MSIEQAIKKAIEGGWKPQILEGHRDLCSCGGELECAAKLNKFVLKENQPEMFLDPLFWQALGKSMGWCIDKSAKAWNEQLDYYEEPVEEISKYDWLYHWHRFVGHLATGRSAEEFFRELE